MDVTIGVPINCKSGYMLKEFLQNQEQIKITTKFSSNIAFSTEDRDFCPELEEYLLQTDLDYAILTFEVEKPEWARDRIWALTQAREVIRKYCIENDSQYLIFLDSDMTFDPDLVNILIDKAMEGFDVVYNCYFLKNGRITFNGFGGTLISRDIYREVPFRCYETADHRAVIDEGFYFEMDLLRRNAKIFSGILCRSAHYSSPGASLRLEPRPLSILERIKSSYFLRKTLSFIAEVPILMVQFVKIGYFLGKYVW